jgi:NADH dehydrogenase FAD-containing subunit
VTLVEAGEILGSFDRTLRDYAARTLKKNGVVIKRGVVKTVEKNYIELR